MTNLKKYAERRTENQRLDKIVEGRKKRLASINKKYDEYNDTCSHDFSLYFGKSYHYGKDEGYTICLGCGKHCCLKDEFLEEQPNLEGIIDISNVIPEENLYTIKGAYPIMFLKAQETLDRLASEETENEFYTLSGIKQAVIEDIIKYDRRINEAREKRYQEYLTQKQEVSKGSTLKRLMSFPKNKTLSYPKGKTRSFPKK